MVSLQPQTIVLPLRLDVLVYSGIAPPAEVLARLKETKLPTHRKPTNPVADKLAAERQDSEFGQNQVPPTPVEGVAGPAYPFREGLPEYADAPPSYEDAIASDVPPVAAPRPEYVPPPHQEDDLLGRDEKGKRIGD